jgi:hypothetical protein
MLEFFKTDVGKVALGGDLPRAYLNSLALPICRPRLSL